ncbi:MAG TPA: SprT family zinc-dependent metalloprotease [Solirubrobacterales bacterium]|nr:SprT family zinc-dependent metalloprotease [Solirubrobacterales bacterium]
MSTASAYLTVAGINVDVVYKDIKNLHIGVYPPVGRVRVAAPRRLDDDQVRLALVKRLPWIKSERDRLQRAERQSQREMVTGESHYVWGDRYRLKLVERGGHPHVELDGESLVLYLQQGTSPEQRRELLGRWYRERLREAVPDAIARWEPTIGVQVPRWTIRRMKTKWGSCNRKTGHIWFNVELAKKHPDGLEYIAVHEMTHLLERGHGARFTRLMDGFMPDWRARRDRLNDAPLASEIWK